MCEWPRWEPSMSGVMRSSFWLFTEAPARTRSFTTPMWPSCDARMSAVVPFLFARSTSAFASMSISAISSRPKWLACSSAVEPFS